MGRCEGKGSWNWTDIMGDDTNWESHAPQNVKDWLALNAYDGKAYLAVNNVKVTPINAGDPAGTVVADTWYISEGSNNVQPSYQYSCFVDVTSQVTAITTALPRHQVHRGWSSCPSQPRVIVLQTLPPSIGAARPTPAGR